MELTADRQTEERPGHRFSFSSKFQWGDASHAVPQQPHHPQIDTLEWQLDVLTLTHSLCPIRALAGDAALYGCSSPPRPSWFGFLFIQKGQVTVLGVLLETSSKV